MVLKAFFTDLRLNDMVMIRFLERFGEVLLDIVIVICYILDMRCKICQNEFIPNKYRPQQQVCSQPECQKIRQAQNLKAWRTKNPDYFKCLGQEGAWRDTRHRYSKLWKATHREHIKDYDHNHNEQRREYMREYMRRYRQKTRQFRAEKTSNVNGNKS